MSIRRKLAVMAVSLLASVGVMVGVATPAHAWTYCNPPMSSGVMYFTDNQGYCGDVWAWTITAADAGDCIYLGQYANRAGSVANKSGRAIIATDSINCTGSDSFSMPAGQSHPNLYAINGKDLGNKISAFYVV